MFCFSRSRRYEGFKERRNIQTKADRKRKAAKLGLDEDELAAEEAEQEAEAATSARQLDAEDRVAIAGMKAAAPKVGAASAAGKVGANPLLVDLLPQGMVFGCHC